MVPIALAFAFGVTLPALGVRIFPTLLPLLLLPALLLLWIRPWPVGVLSVVVLAGCLSGESHLRGLEGDCRFQIPPGWSGTVEGRFLARPLPGRALPFRLEAGGPIGCNEVIRATLPEGSRLPGAGERIVADGSWFGRTFPQEEMPAWAGTLRLSRDWEGRRGGGLSGWTLAVRGEIQERIVLLWGDEMAAMVEALVLERREHVDGELREAFSLSGTVHLLSISGFHVGVIAALLVGALRLVGVPPRSAGAGAVLICWMYVLGIGAPHAAVRASLLFTLLVGARLRGRPASSAGVLASCVLLLLILAPGWLLSVGFQLSVAGTAGLIFLRRPVAEAIDGGYRRLCGRGLPAGKRVRGGEVLLREGAAGIAAGIAATLPTLPFLAWHFDRISLLGIPLTLVLAPIFAMVIPGIGVALGASLIHTALGTFVAGGTALLLEVCNRIVLLGSLLPGASFWVSRDGLFWVLLAGASAHLVLRWKARRRVRPGVRHAIAAGWGAAALLLLPVLPRERTLEVHMIDVGQGDAIAIRSPSGRWLLVDAGPRSATFDSGERRIVPYLRREGVRKIEGLVLTHPHLDHIGGAPAVMEEFRVGGVLDPSRPHGSRPYLEVLEAAKREGGSWWEARRGMSFLLDGAVLEVLHPHSEIVEATLLPDPNDLSIVLLIRWGRATILLTGDAPSSVEREVAGRIPELTILKVGHHGSRTSSAPELLDRGRPTYAIVGAGDGNSFGHPHAEVVNRLTERGTAVLRTDRDGDIRIRIRFNGEAEVWNSH